MTISPELRTRSMHGPRAADVGTDVVQGNGYPANGEFRKKAA
ncbi:hypothetical protein [Variovorax sp. DXTD-1]|nr:hypothetical protein [Variovorax sp. DXTD-1]